MGPKFGVICPLATRNYGRQTLTIGEPVLLCPGFLSGKQRQMTPEKHKALEEHIEAIAKILFEETEPEDLESLAKIEATVRDQTLEHITPQIGFFLSNKVQGQKQDESEN